MRSSREAQVLSNYWDSRHGENFRLDITPSPTATLQLDDTWQERATGPLKAGSAFAVEYDVDRLRDFLDNGWYRMGNTLAIRAFVSFDDRPATALSLTNWDMDHSLHVARPTVEIPEDAREVRVWFRGSTVGPGMYDSNLGADSRFPVEP